MSILQRIGLGTAQFGADYGISNKMGRPDEQEISRILFGALDAGLGYLDTASGYGDAESLIGRQLPRDCGLKIVTKIPAITSETIGEDYKQLVLDSVVASLRRLRVDQLYGLLVHRADDLERPGWEYVVEALQTARERGWTLRVGASVYNDDEIALVESRFCPGLIQLPYSVVDRRLANSRTLVRLSATGTEIHARSVFLQGLLLMPLDQLPPYFAPLRGEFALIRDVWSKQRTTPLTGCLAGVLQQPEISAAIVGVNREGELREIIAAACEISVREIDTGETPSIDPIYLDPSKWPQVSR